MNPFPRKTEFVSLGSTSPFIGIILRGGKENDQLTLFRQDNTLCFLHAVNIPEPEFYSGHLVGLLGDSPVVIVAGSAPENLPGGVETQVFSARIVPGGSDKLHNIGLKKDLTAADFASPDEYNIVFNAALYAKGYARLPRINAVAGADGIVLPYPHRQQLASAA